MLKESHLFDQLRKADAAGDTEYARQVKAKIEEQRTAWSQANNFTDNRIVDKYGLEGAIAKLGEQNQDFTDPTEGMGTGETLLTGVGRGVMDVGQGVSQIIREDMENKGFAPEGSADAYTAEKTKELQHFEKLADESPWTAGAGRLVGNMAAAPIPAGGGTNALTRMVTTGLGSGVASGAEFVPEGGSRGQNAAMGFGFGSGMQGLVGEPLRKLSNKGINAANQNYNLSDDMADAVKFADAEKLPLYYDDIKMNGIAQKVGQQIDEVPIIGGAKSREIQNTAAKKAAKDLVDKFAPDTQMDDLYGEVSQSAKRQLDRVKDIASKKYQKAYEGLNSAGEFDLPQVRNQIGEIIKKEAASGTMADQTLIKELQKIQQAPSGTFEQWAGIRSKVLGTIRDATRGQNANVGSTATKSLEEASQALSAGLDDAAAQIGGKGGAQWKQANQFYKNTVVDYKKGVLANAVKNENPEQILNTLIGRGGGKGTDSKFVAEKLFKGLDKKGKDTVKYALLEKSYSEALQENGVFSPARFASNLEKFKARTGVLFDAENKAYIDGLTKYMRLAQNSGDFAANIKTGQKAVGTAYALAAGAGGVLNPGATITGAGGVVGIEKLFRTKRGRSFLLAMSKTTPESKQAADLITKINAYLARGGALATVQPEAQ